MKKENRHYFFIFFIISLLFLVSAQEAQAAVTSYVGHGDACRFPAEIPAGYEMVHSIISPSMMDMVGSHTYDTNNVTVRNGTYSVNAPYDGYVIYLHMSHFYWMDSNVQVYSPGFNYNVTAWSPGNGGLYTDPGRGCGDSLTGLSRYKVTLSAGTTTFTSRTINASHFYIYAPPSPPNKPAVTSYTDYQKITDNTPTFTWNYSHPNGKPQQRYRMARSLNGAPWIYDEVASAATTHTFPALTDGTWDFAVEVFDGTSWSGWTYRSQMVIDSTGPNINLSQNMNTILYNSPTEKRGVNEFLAYADIAPTIDANGLVPYVISFDIKADVAGSVQVYQQNGSDAKYTFYANVNATTAYTRQQVTVTPTIKNASLTQSMLAFYGVYGSGRIINVKNVQIRKASEYWTNQPITITASASDVSGVQSIQLGGQTSILGRNFTPNGDFSRIQTVAAGWMGWDDALNGTLVPTSGWSSGYNNGVANAAKGYHAHLDTSLGYTAMKFPNKNEQYGERNRWLGILQTFGNGSAFESQLAVGTNVTISFDMYSDKVGGSIDGGLYRKSKTTGTTAFSERKVVKATRSYMWERKSFTVRVDEDWDFDYLFSIYLYGHREDDEATKWIKNIKVEIGNKATPYTKALEDVAVSVNPKTYQVTQNGTYTFNATDTLGNVGSNSITIANYDNTEPTLNLSVDGTNYTNQDVAITASATDSQSGVASVRLYRTSFDKNILGMEDFEPWSATSFTKNGNKIQFKNEDAYSAGIKIPYPFVEEGQQYVLSFDMTKLSGEIPFIGGHGYYDENTIEVLIDGVPVSEPKKWGGGIPYPNDGQKHHVTVKFKVASVNEWDKNFYIQPNRGNYGTHRYEVLFENIQLEKGTAESPYAPNTKDRFAKTKPNTLMAERNGTYEFIAVDYAGNETIKSITINHIDKSAPTLSLSANTTALTKDNVELTVSATDSHSGVSSLRLHKASSDKNLVAMEDISSWNAPGLLKNGTKLLFDNTYADHYGAGIKMQADLFEDGKQYVLSFDITKLSGEITLIGGHAHAIPSKNEIYIDGIRADASKMWGGGVSYPNDLATHHVTVKFTYNSADVIDKNIYIQPNRGDYAGKNYEVQIENLQLEEGTTETAYEPSLRDVFTNTNPGTLSVGKNGRYEFIVRDGAGNTTIKAIEVTNIDKTAPVLVIDKRYIEGMNFSYLAKNELLFPGTVTQQHQENGVNVTYYIEEATTNKKTVEDVKIFEKASHVTNEPFEGKHLISTHLSNGSYHVVVTAQNKLGLTSVEIIPFEVKNPISGGPSININVFPVPTGTWQNKPVDVYIMEAGDAEMLSKAIKFYDITNSSLYPTVFTKTVPQDKKVQVNLQGENFIHVQYILDDGTKISSTAGPYLIDTSAVGEFDMKLINSAGVEVNDWSNEELRLVIGDLAAPSVSGMKKQYRIEGLHTEWQPYVDNLPITIEGKHRILGRVVNGTGMASETRLTESKIDRTKPSVNKLLVEEKEKNYAVAVKTSDALSGIQEVKLSNGIPLNKEGSSYVARGMSEKPNTVRIVDHAGNEISVSAEVVPTITFEAPYEERAIVYRDSVNVTITNATSYQLGHTAYDCNNALCTVVVDYNGTLKASNLNGIKESVKVVNLTNIDRSPLRLILTGEREPNNPNKIQLKWNYQLEDASLQCSEGGTMNTYTVSGTAMTLPALNYVYDCVLSGIYGGEGIASNQVVIQPLASAPIEEGVDAIGGELHVNVYMKETMLGKSYLINTRSKNRENEYVPIPKNEITEY